MAGFFPFNLDTYGGAWRGFDRFASPHWQMVPLQGWRAVILRDGAGLDVTLASDSSTRVGLREVDPQWVIGYFGARPADRAFEITGRQTGAAQVCASRGSAVVARLDVEVKAARPCAISFLFVSDTATPMPHRTRRQPALVGELVNYMDYILRPQANLWVNSLQARPVTVTGDLGPTIRTVMRPPRSNTDAWRRVVAKRDPAADFNIFFVWEVEAVDVAGDEGAITDPPGSRDANCLFEDDIGLEAVADIAKTLAHELGHRYGLSDRPEPEHAMELMSAHTQRRRTFLTKNDINTINPTR